MAIEPTCDHCGDELHTYGAILLSPPNKNNVVQKYHYCIACYKELKKILKKKNAVRSTT
jgi:hypothetical protein